MATKSKTLLARLRTENGIELETVVRWALENGSTSTQAARRFAPRLARDDFLTFRESIRQQLRRRGNPKLEAKRAEKPPTPVIDIATKRPIDTDTDTDTDDGPDFPAMSDLEYLEHAEQVVGRSITKAENDWGMDGARMLPALFREYERIRAKRTRLEGHRSRTRTTAEIRASVQERLKRLGIG